MSSMYVPFGEIARPSATAPSAPTARAAANVRLGAVHEDEVVRVADDPPSRQAVDAPPTAKGAVASRLTRQERRGKGALGGGDSKLFTGEAIEAGSRYQDEDGEADGCARA